MELGFETGRMKTGTPPRVDGRSLDYSKMEEQPGDEIPGRFSYLDTPTLVKQRPCYITYTNARGARNPAHGFEKSPMFQGRIKGLGPRYCPSVEDKINRFADKDRHQIFVEPEGWQHRGNVHQRLQQLAARGRAVPRPAQNRRLRERQDVPARLRHRVRLFPAHPTQPDPGNQARAQPLFRGPDQRHHGLRGSRLPGSDGGHQRPQHACTASSLSS